MNDIEKIERILSNINNTNKIDSMNKYEPIIDIEFLYLLFIISVFDYKKYFKDILKTHHNNVSYYDVD